MANKGNKLVEIPDEAVILVYYQDENKDIKAWQGKFSECPVDTAPSDWYILDTVEEADFIIIQYETSTD